MNTQRSLATALLLVLFAAGCSAPLRMRSFSHPEADYSFYERVGILPFQSEADDRLAGEKVSEFFLTEILIRGPLQVMDPGQFRAVLSETVGVPNPAILEDYSPTQLRQIGAAAEVQGFFIGMVHDYRILQVAGERYPMLSMTVKFVDAPTGTVVWQANLSARGGPNYPIIAAGEQYIMGELTHRVCKKLADDFYKKSGIR